MDIYASNRRIKIQIVNQSFITKNRPDKPDFGARRPLLTTFRWGLEHYTDLAGKLQEEKR